MSQNEHKNRVELQNKLNSMPLDLKNLTDDGTFEGLASPFNNIDDGGDRVLPGAFSKSLSRTGAAGVKMLRNHDQSHIIGKYSEIRETNDGLYVKGQVFNEIAMGAETLFLMRQGVLDSLSIGYRTIQASYAVDKARELIEVALYEISIVAFPMNAEAIISNVKSDAWSKKDVERHLREGGMPQQFAKMLVSKGFDAADAIANDHREGDNDSKGLLESLARLNNSIKG